jgi:hypothetical protein
VLDVRSIMVRSGACYGVHQLRHDQWLRVIVIDRAPLRLPWAQGVAGSNPAATSTFRGPG